MHQQMNRVLRIARAVKGITREQMAEELGLSYEHYLTLESGKAIPGRVALRKISQSTGMSWEGMIVLNTSAPKELDLEHRGMFDKVVEYLMTRFVMRKEVSKL